MKISPARDIYIPSASERQGRQRVKNKEWYNTYRVACRRTTEWSPLKTRHCFTYFNFNMYCDRLVLLMSEVNNSDFYAIYCTRANMKSGKSW